MTRDRLTRRVGRRLPEPFRLALAGGVGRIRATATSVLAECLVAALRILPKRVLGRLKERLTVTTTLDSPGRRVRLVIDSEIEVTTRSISCRKEPETLAWARDIVSPGDVVFDIGANVGAYALLVDELHNGACTVYAFEPAFANFAQLNKNIFLNRCNGRVIPIQIALSDSRGLNEFAYSSLTPGSALHGLTGTSDSKQPVLTLRLDDLSSIFDLPRPNHIKLDVDGAEHAILTGATETLADPELRSVLVELESGRPGQDRIAASLRSYGFDVRSRHPHGPGAGAPENCIFVRRKH